MSEVDLELQPLAFGTVVLFACVFGSESGFYAYGFASLRNNLEAWTSAKYSVKWAAQMSTSVMQPRTSAYM